MPSKSFFKAIPLLAIILLISITFVISGKALNENSEGLEIVLVVDQSSSSSSDADDLRFRGVEHLVDLVGKDHVDNHWDKRYRIAIVNFGSMPVIWPFEEGDNWFEIPPIETNEGIEWPGEFSSIISSLSDMPENHNVVQDQTAIDDALKEARKLFETDGKNYRRAVILISDLQAYEQGQNFNESMRDIDTAADKLGSASLYVLGIGNVSLWEDIQADWETLKPEGWATIVKDDATMRQKLKIILDDLTAGFEPPPVPITDKSAPTVEDEEKSKETSAPTATPDLCEEVIFDMIGDIFKDSENYEKAAEFYVQQLIECPTLAVTSDILTTRLAGVLDDINQVEALIKSVNLAIAKKAFEEGKYGEAISQYRIVLSDDPDDKDAKNGIIAALEKIKQNESSTIDVNYAIAEKYFEEGKYDEAISHYKIVLNIDPAHEGANISIKEAIEKIKQNESSTIDVNYAIAEKYFEEGKYDEAISHYKIVLNIDPAHEGANIRIKEAIHEDANIRIKEPIEKSANPFLLVTLGENSQIPRISWGPVFTQIGRIIVWGATLLGTALAILFAFILAEAVIVNREQKEYLSEDQFAILPFENATAIESLSAVEKSLQILMEENLCQSGATVYDKGVSVSKFGINAPEFGVRFFRLFLWLSSNLSSDSKSKRITLVDATMVGKHKAMYEGKERTVVGFVVRKRGLYGEQVREMRKFVKPVGGKVGLNDYVVLVNQASEWLTLEFYEKLIEDMGQILTEIEELLQNHDEGASNG